MHILEIKWENHISQMFHSLEGFQNQRYQKDPTLKLQWDPQKLQFIKINLKQKNNIDYKRNLYQL